MPAACSNGTVTMLITFLFFINAQCISALLFLIYPNGSSLSLLILYVHTSIHRRSFVSYASAIGYLGCPFMS